MEGDQEIIVMSDLKAEGYQMQDRFKGLDMEHVQKTLTKIAKFHASSVLYKEKVIIMRILSYNLIFIIDRFVIF